MRIEDLTQIQSGNTARIEASVIWEDSERPQRKIFFETDRGFADALVCGPHPFLVACAIPAMRHGEQRITVDAPICPELRRGLTTAMGWLCHWYGSPRRPVSIETKPGIHQPLLRASRGAGSFLSGGVDSLATLRANRLDFPLDHPDSIQDCLVVHGFDIGGVEKSGSEDAFFERTLAALSPVVQDAKVMLIPVHTNVRHLDDDVYFWMDEFFGAALASVAHAVSGRLASVAIASGLNIPNVRPHGSNPLLDPNYSSHDLQVRHDGVTFSRLDKVRLIADWPVGLKNLRVCTMNPNEMLNCGKCDKCLRTMTELLAIGRLADTQVFPIHDVSTEMLDRISFEAGYDVAFYQELIDPLISQGRQDLVKVIASKSREYRGHQAWLEERDWKGSIKRFDRKFLGSGLYNSYKSFRARAGHRG